MSHIDPFHREKPKGCSGCFNPKLMLWTVFILALCFVPQIICYMASSENTEEKSEGNEPIVRDPLSQGGGDEVSAVGVAQRESVGEENDSAAAPFTVADESEADSTEAIAAVDTTQVVPPDSGRTEAPVPCDPLKEAACALAALEGLWMVGENRCSAYNRDDYEYEQSVEATIIRELGGMYSPYTGEEFESRYDADIEHMVAISEAHDSGLCSYSADRRSAFASDPLNLTLASPYLNRNQKRNSDAGEWLPPRNRCWFAARVVAVRKKYNLTVDRIERRALERVLRNCDSVELIRP